MVALENRGDATPCNTLYTDSRSGAEAGAMPPSLPYLRPRDAGCNFPGNLGPVTIGIRQWTLLLPPSFLHNVEADDLDAVFAHECAHLHRRDFAKNLLYGLVAVPVSWHPLLWLTRLRLAETREMVCDAMAAEAVAGRESYANSLLRLASMLSNRMAAENLHAIGIFDLLAEIGRAHV